MNQLTQFKENPTKYLIYCAVALLFINFILMFLPFVEVYQPSYSETSWGETTYKGWHSQLAPMAMFIYPIFLTGIPYLCSVISVYKSFKKKNNNNDFFKIKNNAIDKPINFFWLKFGAIANIISMFLVYLMLKSEVEYLEEYGAYCSITFFGFLNILCTIAFIALLFYFSRKTKDMFTLVNKSQMATVTVQSTDANSTEESDK